MARSDRYTPSLLDPPKATLARLASVAPLRPVDKVFTYLIPEKFEEQVRPGVRVSVPFGREDKLCDGIVLSVSDGQWSATHRPVHSVYEDVPALSPQLLELGQWVARYYGAHLGRTLDLIVPAAAKRRAGWKKKKYVMLDEASGSSARLTKGQVSILDALAGVSGKAIRMEDLCAAASCTPAAVQTLAKRGLVRIETRLEPDGARATGPLQTEPKFELSSEQTSAIVQIDRAVDSGAFSVQVLFGVTGSGKTEVYVQAIRRAIENNRQAILLVPEIALTTQTIHRLASRFENVATLHSGLSDTQRSIAWSAIAEGRTSVIIGTRSAVFAPANRLGLIIVDEEAEPSYKNQAAPRYHTRDVAVARGQLESIPVVLGSATPSLETWHNVKTRKHYHLIRMPHRVRGLEMPKIHLVDMHEEHRVRRGVNLLSREMEGRLAAALNQKQQAVLLLNRRGYANYVHCPRCRAVINCPHCSVRMVYHATTKLLHCHYCRTREPVPNRCHTAQCQGSPVPFGLGTQRVEEELAKKFPTARVSRMDSDVMKKVSDYAAVLEAFERRESDILLGTQMIAKGLDFPFVSFVGIISADTALSLNDFRAEERTFQLVLQVAGRSGRGLSNGNVVVQTFAADTIAVQHAVAGDYEGFANQELTQRKKNHLPPFTRMVRIILSDAKVSRVEKEAMALSERLRDAMARWGIKAQVFDAAPAFVTRINDLYRFDIQMIFETGTGIIKAMDLFKSEGILRVGVKSVVTDVDPVSLQ
jgi:primosomal protein N' (replication factor Y)